jgi:hypothetical protein
MDRVTCPTCGYTVGLGMASEFGSCPKCETPLVLTCEFRALSEEDLKAEMERRLAASTPGYSAALNSRS